MWIVIPIALPLWIREIEFVEERQHTFKGEGGYNEDNESLGTGLEGREA